MIISEGLITPATGKITAFDAQKVFLWKRSQCGKSVKHGPDVYDGLNQICERLSSLPI